MTDAVHFPQIRRSKMRKMLKILLVALLPFASATCTRTLRESCMAEDFCAIKHNNPFMNTFSDVSVCGDREVFKDPRDDWRSECWIDSCNKRRKGRKLLGGPIPQVKAGGSSDRHGGLIYAKHIC